MQYYPWLWNRSCGNALKKNTVWFAVSRLPESYAKGEGKFTLWASQHPCEWSLGKVLSSLKKNLSCKLKKNWESLLFWASWQKVLPVHEGRELGQVQEWYLGKDEGLGDSKIVEEKPTWHWGSPMAPHCQRGSSTITVLPSRSCPASPWLASGTHRSWRLSGGRYFVCAGGRSPLVTSVIETTSGTQGGRTSPMFGKQPKSVVRNSRQPSQS